MLTTRRKTKEQLISIKNYPRIPIGIIQQDRCIKPVFPTLLSKNHRSQATSCFFGDGKAVWVKRSGIITQKFTEGGRDIIGISTEAPIYKILYSQTIGFPFQFAGVDCEILSIQ